MEARTFMNLQRVFSILGMLSAVLFIFFALAKPVVAEERTVIGATEEIVLHEWKVKMPARIDSGAGYTSIDARDVRIQEKYVFFRLPKKYGGAPLRYPIEYMVRFRSSYGSELRPVIKMKICLGRVLKAVIVSLKDRRRLRFPVLIGRNMLTKHFNVDVSKRMAARPDCSRSKLETEPPGTVVPKSFLPVPQTAKGARAK